MTKKMFLKLQIEEEKNICLCTTVYLKKFKSIPLEKLLFLIKLFLFL